MVRPIPLLTLRSFAKLNLYLRVINKRKDNYHNLETLFCRISLADRITIKQRDDGFIRVKCSNPDVPKGQTNLCYRAAQLLRQEFNLKHGLEIGIIKRIPPGAGLGGGSSNAASVLIGLNKLWKLNLAKERLASIGAKIGADVPFFIYGAKFAVGTGRGDKISVLKELSGLKLWFILIFPGFKVSTPLIYRRWDAYLSPSGGSGMPKRRPETEGNSCPTGLTRLRRDVKIIISSLLHHKSFSYPHGFFNHLEAVTTRFYPQLMRVKKALQEKGLEQVMMSGSGPAVFALCASRGQAEGLSCRLRRENKNWQVFAVSTL